VDGQELKSKGAEHLFANQNFQEMNQREVIALF
jgi:hypothetical protein